MNIPRYVAFAPAPTETAPEVAPMNVTTYVVYGVAVLLLISVIVFFKVVFFNRRPQKMALVFTLLAIPLYLVYYDDQFRHLVSQFEARSWVRGLVERYSATERFDPDFTSDITPAIMVGLILLFHLMVLQRLAAREHLQRIANLTSTFFAGSIAATMLGGTIVSTFHLGWPGALGIGFGFALLYLGALALLAAIVEITAELAKLAWVWIKRQVFAIGTLITRGANWIAALGGRLVSPDLLERIRAANAAQALTFLQEQDDQDRRLIEAYIHDLDRKRQARLRAMRAKYGDVDSSAQLNALEQQSMAGEPAAPAASSSLAPPPPARDPFDTEPFQSVSPSGSEPTTREQ